MTAPRMEIGGLTEAAAELGVSIPTMWRWEKDPDFPEPVAELAMGKVYLLPEIRNYRRRLVLQRRKRRVF